MNTQATTPQAAAPIVAGTKIFSSRDLKYAIKQAVKNGYRALNQGMAAIAGESAVQVKTWKDAAKLITTPAGKTVLGYQTLTQTRQMVVDMRTEEQKALGSTEGIRKYQRVLQAQIEVTEPGVAALVVGTALGKNNYLVEVLTYSPVYPGHEGIVMSSQGVKRYSYKFRMQLDSYNPERHPDVLLLTPAESEAFNKGQRAGLLNFVQAQQLESGLLTQAELDKAIAADKNGQPQPSDDANQEATNNTVSAHGEDVDPATGEVVTGQIQRTGFGRSQN